VYLYTKSARVIEKYLLLREIRIFVQTEGPKKGKKAENNNSFFDLNSFDCDENWCLIASFEEVLIKYHRRSIIVFRS